MKIYFIYITLVFFLGFFCECMDVIFCK